MKERLYIGMLHQRPRPLEVCTCGGELQLRLSPAETFGPRGWEPAHGGVVRVKLEPVDLQRLADFFTEVADQYEENDG